MNRSRLIEWIDSLTHGHVITINPVSRSACFNFPQRFNVPRKQMLWKLNQNTIWIYTRLHSKWWVLTRSIVSARRCHVVELLHQQKAFWWQCNLTGINKVWLYMYVTDLLSAVLDCAESVDDGGHFGDRRLLVSIVWPITSEQALVCPQHRVERIRGRTCFYCF